jgi:hypothetical protein
MQWTQRANQHVGSVTEVTEMKTGKWIAVACFVACVAVNPVKSESPPAPAPDPTPVPDNTLTSAQVTVGQQTFTPRNLSAHFERIAVQPQQSVQITLTFPQDELTNEVRIAALDGGTINGERTKRFSLENSRTVEFTFTLGPTPGLYQLGLSRGSHDEVMEFWVSSDRPEYDAPALK